MNAYRIKVALGIVAGVAALGLVAGCIPPPPPFPTADSTGVPAGVSLSTYTGPTTITSCQTISNKTINSDLIIRASNGQKTIYNSESAAKANSCVKIINTRIKGLVDDLYTSRGNGPVFFADSEIANPSARDVAAVSDTNVHMWRSYVHGARSGVQCDGFCEIHDSYVLADRESGNAHMDAFISNGAYGAPTLLDHNSFLCKPTTGVPNGAGCAADVGLFPDFSAQSFVTMTNNQFLATDAAYYCLHSPYEPAKPYGTQGHDNVFRDNVFQKGTSGKCGGADAVYDWNNSAGKWCRNLYDDGTKVLPSNPDSC